MARSFLVDVDLNKSQLLNAAIHNLAGAPPSPVVGQVYVNTTGGVNRFYVWDGTAWVLKATDSDLLQGQNGAYYLSRANHTGTQLAATISDLTEAAQDAVGGALTGTATLGLTYNDGANTISGAVLDSPTVGGATPANLRDRATHTGSQLSSTVSDFTEAAQDAVGAALTGTATVGFTYNDAANTIAAAVLDSPTVAGATPANLRDRSTHTGTQTASTISDLTSVVQAYRLDQFAVPTLDLSLNTHKITNLVDPANPQDAATKNYVDLARQGIRMKQSVKAATTAAITLSGAQTIDGISIVATDRVLVKNQAAPETNGIYVCASGAWTRDLDADTAAELADGATVWVNQGTLLANSTWSQINTITTLGTDAQTWVQQGSATAYVGGAGLTITGSTFDVGQGTGISVAADTVGIDTTVVARKFTQALSTSATSYVVTHGLSNQWATVQVFQNGSPFAQVDVDIELTDANNTTLRFATAPTSNAYRVVCTG